MSDACVPAVVVRLTGLGVTVDRGGFAVVRGTFDTQMLQAEAGRADLFVGVYGVDHDLDLELQYRAAVAAGTPRFLYTLAGAGERVALDSPMRPFLETIARDSASAFETPEQLADHVGGEVAHWLEARAAGRPSLSVVEPDRDRPQETPGLVDIVGAPRPRADGEGGPGAAPPDGSVAPERASPSKEPLPFSALADHVLRRAVALRAAARASEIGSDTLLVAMLVEGGALAAVLAAHGLSIDAARADVATWTTLREARLSLDGSDEPFGTQPVTANVAAIRDRAERIARERRSPRLRERHLLRAVLSRKVQGARAHAWLERTLDARTPLAALRDLLDRWPEDERITADGVRRRLDALRPAAARHAASDAAATDDRLDFALQARTLAEVLVKPETRPPVVVGVYGPWGSGKSTFLQLVGAELTALHARDEARRRKLGLPRPPQLICLRYNAWAYADAGRLWTGLVAKVSRLLDERMGFWRRLAYWARRHGLRLASAAAVGALPVGAAIASVLATGAEDWVKALAATGLSGGAAALLLRLGLPHVSLEKTVAGLAGKFDAAPLGGVMGRVQEEMKGVIERHFVAKEARPELPAEVRAGKLKVVVFIDELDRCPLHRIVDVLEAIKVFLAEEIFLVVMAVDTRVAAEAIRMTYKDVENPDLARQYLEKIVQIPIEVPRAGAGEIRSYVASLLSVPAAPGGPGEAAAPPPAPAAGARLETPYQRELRQALGVGTGIRAELPKRVVAATAAAGGEADAPAWEPAELADTPVELEAMAALGHAFLDGNPRRLKRLVNTYRYVKLLARRRGEPVGDEAWQRRMAAWLVFSLAWPDALRRAADEALSGAPGWTRLGERAVDEGGPTRAALGAHLDVEPEELARLARLAPNFLGEHPRPAG